MRHVLLNKAAHCGFYVYSGVLLAALAVCIIGDFGSDTRGYGNWHAPDSDALQPWLHGALEFVFWWEPVKYLYRPTVGILFGTLIALFGRIEAVPVFFAGLFVVVVSTALLRRSDWALRLSLVGWLTVSVLQFQSSLSWINFGCLMPDVLALCLALWGIYLLAQVTNAPRIELTELCAGALCLGCAAAIRGPMLLGGPIVLASLFFGYKDRITKKHMALALILFALPIALDIAYQQAYGVLNNGLASLFCAYSTDYHVWDLDCQEQYFRELPPASTVVKSYFSWLLTSEGYTSTLAQLRIYLRDRTRLYESGPGLHVTVVLAVVGLLQVYGSLTARASYSSRFDSFRAFFRIERDKALRIVSVLGALFIAELCSLPMAIIGSVVVLHGCLVHRLWRPLMLLLAYWASIAFLSLSHLITISRLSESSTFLLPLAFFMFMLETPDSNLRSSGKPQYLCSVPAWSTLIILVFLYTGIFLLPDPKLKHTFIEKVQGRNAALKISEDRHLDRCLYFTGQRVLLYFRCDDRAIGDVVQFSAIDGAERAFSPSYRDPARFIP